MIPSLLLSEKYLAKIVISTRKQRRNLLIYISSVNGGSAHHPAFLLVATPVGRLVVEDPVPATVSTSWPGEWQQGSWKAEWFERTVVGDGEWNGGTDVGLGSNIGGGWFAGLEGGSEWLGSRPTSERGSVSSVRAGSKVPRLAAGGQRPVALEVFVGRLHEAEGGPFAMRVRIQEKKLLDRRRGDDSELFGPWKEEEPDRRPTRHGIGDRLII
ncbi:hypothetical protein KFK09_022207 [Dendrobium nobile]|uniref:Uncharacterized protein n=1 Tax=Dendrobium nobile TaxID=94219 RepID=A0A8T3AIF9_DENNO|nr:hypothetical protein KFK09_022207 [Dendrobium nobile]